ncbi:Disintegrin and metalloproteinase domain-containing protein 10 [Halotydeus destructor]|nr:Disintegrin and metalloproteinase domain-containing protein 10 [Halotydeus destructor]
MMAASQPLIGGKVFAICSVLCLISSLCESSGHHSKQGVKRREQGEEGGRLSEFIGRFDFVQYDTTHPAARDGRRAKRNANIAGHNGQPGGADKVEQGNSILYAAIDHGHGPLTSTMELNASANDDNNNSSVSHYTQSSLIDNDGGRSVTPATSSLSSSDKSSSSHDKQSTKANGNTRTLNPREPSSSQSSSRTVPHEQVLQIDFIANGRPFKLRLKPDAESVFSPDLIIESSEGKPIRVSLDHIYSGHLENEPNSRVYGSLDENGIFEGKMFTDSGTYYVERADRYFPSLNSSQRMPGHSVIYMSEDVSHPYLETLGAGCGSGAKQGETRQWMDRVSNSGVEEPEMEDPKVTAGKNKYKLKDVARAKRSPQGFPFDFSTPTLSFSSGGRRDNGARPEDIWSRNAQSRISHDRKDFYPPQSPVTTQFPSSTIKKRACSLYIQTDTYLWDHIRKEVSSDFKAREEIASLVAQHIKAVNHIYENSDFNGIRGLKFIVQRLKINDTFSCSPEKRDHNPFCSPNIDVSNFLNLNSQFNHNDFCLAYIFTYRDFSGGTLGLAWVASTSGASGGICEKYKSYTENIHGRQVQTKRSLNTGIITFVNYNSRVPPKVSELTLAHEIGHNFGSPHDYPLDCRPGGTQGNFIMYSSATSGERANNNKFSPCSIRNISSVLHAVFNNEGKENCFQEDNGPFCGNKIVEEGEECDCGYDQKECTEQCCYPKEIEPYKDQDPNAQPCTRRRGAICSPSEGPCCSETCRYERSHKLCRHESECTYESFCNGYRAACPAAPAKPNKTECNGGTQVCWRGHCVGSICQKYDLEECFLTSKSGAKSDEMCEVACQRGSDSTSCRRTSEIIQMRNISGLKLRPGSPCNDFQGYCDVFQRCRAVDAEGPLAKLKNLLFNQETIRSIKIWITTYWWACMLMGVAIMLFMAAFIKCCAVHTPSSNPKKKPALRISDTLRRPADTLRRKRQRQNQARIQSGRTNDPLGSTLAVQVPPSSAGPPIPMQPSAPPPVHHQYPTVSSSGQGYQRQSMSHSQATTQLVVALPPETSGSSGYSGGHRGASIQPIAPPPQYLTEPPPPYPGHGPPLPPRPTAPNSVTGPTHGYGEGRGHYNRRSGNAVVAAGHRQTGNLSAPHQRQSHFVDK